MSVSKPGKGAPRILPVKTASGRFGPGNPGKPKGARSRATLAAEALLEGEAEKLTRKAVEMALAGDGMALRLCIERLVPPRRDRPIQFRFPPINTVADHAPAIAAVMAAVASGDITPGEGETVIGLMDRHRRAVETADLETRLSALEGRTTAEPPR